MTAPLSDVDRELMMRCPLTEVVPASLKGISGGMWRRIVQVRELRQRGFIRVELDVDASNARTITRTLHLTPAGIAALHGRVG